MLMLLYPLSAAAADKVRLQLKWQHQFQFAGYYAALAQGYYQASGLDVEIIPCRPDEDAVQKVLQGKAEFGVGSTELLLLREQGAPLVVLAVIFQHSPLNVIDLTNRFVAGVEAPFLYALFSWIFSTRPDGFYGRDEQVEQFC